jgi:hypothetical protein
VAAPANRASIFRRLVPELLVERQCLGFKPAGPVP